MQNAGRTFAFIRRQLHVCLASSLIFVPICIGTAIPTAAQEATRGTEGPSSAAAPVVPQQVRYAGKLSTRANEIVEAEFRIYAAAEGGDPLWTETQRVTVGEDGSYSVLLGAASSAGLPQTVFAGGAARWLGVSVERAAEQERVLLSSVPYAMKSADAESLSGHSASDFVTQEQLAQMAARSEQPPTANPEAQSNGSGPVSGLGTTGTVPLWSGANALGNSVITQLGSNIGINLTAPSATLDVAGSATIRGTLSVGPVAPATTAGGQNSQHLNLTADAWSTATNSALAQTFDWVAAAVGNNTASPSGTLYLQFQSGTAPRTNLFNINSAGIINWATGQTFPGTIGSVTATSPVTATTTSGAVSLGLNTTALETTLNTLYPQLAAADVFSKSVVAHQTAGPGNAAIEGIGTSGSVGALGISDTGYGVEGTSTSGFGAVASVTTPAHGSAGVLGFTGTTHSSTYTAEAAGANAGIWADTSAVGTGYPVGLFATGDDAYGAAIVTNGSDYPAMFATNSGGTAATFTAASGYGVDATTTTGTGVYASTASNGDGVEGFISTAAEQEAGVLGLANVASAEGSTYNIYSGVWGDTGTSSTTVAPAWAVGVLGTADDGHAGVFINNSSGFSTLYAENDASTGVTGLFKTLMAKSADGTCGIGSGGSLSCTGQIKSLVSSGNGQRKVETYAVQSPENWMEDFGSGQLQKGVAVVTIDLAFAETVTGDANYHVFLTPRGDSKGLYVINATPNTFEVRESGGGTSSLAFDYRIVAKRRGFERQRLVDVTERFNAEQKAATMMKSSGTRHKPAPLAKSPLLAALDSHPRSPEPKWAPTSVKPSIRSGVSTQP